jgi:hypothetical protein
LTRAELTEALRRHRRLFGGASSAGALALFWHELRVRRALDVLFAPLLMLPLVGGVVASCLRRRLVCAFAGFLDGAETRVGCLIHPGRTNGKDLRRAAFRLLSGFECGPADYLCAGARNFRAASHLAKRRFHSETEGMDWHGYGLAASSFVVEAD